MPSNHLILCCPFLLLSSIFPSIRVFSHESALCIRWPKYCASALVSVFPMNIQDWFPWGLNGLISLLFKGLSPQPRFPDPGIESRSSVLQADSLLSEPPRKPYNPVRVCMLIASVVPNSANLWTAVHQASLSMGFFKQDYWSGLPCAPPEDLSNPGIELSLALQVDSLPAELPGKPRA